MKQSGMTSSLWFAGKLAVKVGGPSDGKPRFSGLVPACSGKPCDGPHENITGMGDLGNDFAQAFAAKDFDAVADLLDPEVDFRGLTPSRTWEAHGPEAVVADVLTSWLEDSDDVESLDGVERTRFADRQHIAYRLTVTNPDGRFVFEQQAYFTERDGRIAWMRVLCSGFRPAEA
jgi:hypothetical protein